MLKKTLLGIAFIALVGVILPTPARAAGPGGSFQAACFPLDAPDYAFWQYISGWGHHLGDDICHQEGTPVFATADGTVMYSARTPDSYRWGNLIIIQHNTNVGPVISLYGHLRDDRRVGAGQGVGKGQLIGYVGPEGPQNGFWGPHTHFGLRVGAYNAPVGSYATYIHGYDPPASSGWTDSLVFANARRADYDFVSQEEDHGSTMYYNDGMDVTIKLWNTGQQTWHATGSNAVKLGTSNPRDRGSGFSQNGSASGWLSNSRVKLQADTAPGQLGTFQFRLESNQTPGNYNECFEPVIDGLIWMSDRRICVPFTLLPPGWRGQVVNQLVTSSSDPTVLGNPVSAQGLIPGQKINLKAIIKNTGELPWDVSGANTVHLAGSRPQDRGSGFATMGDNSIPASENWLSNNRASAIDGRYDSMSNTVVSDAQITTGETAVFSFTITVPDSPGPHPEYFNPVVEGKTWMPDLGMYFPLSVADRGFHYQWVNQTQTTSTINGSSGNTIDATLQLKNVGQQSWPVGGSLRLGTDNPRDAASPFYTSSGTGAWLAPNRLATVGRNVTTNGKGTVDAGETGEFTFRITVPSPVGPGSYRLYIQPVADGTGWLPENYGMYFPVNVTAPAYDSRVDGQQFSQDYHNFPHGSQMSVKVAVTNTGRVAWPVSGANAVHLGTARPFDRGSGFATMSGADQWLSNNRAATIDGRITNLNTFAFTSATQINPGQTALFTVPLTATPDPGFYPEYFDLVAEGIGWFPDRGINFPLTVTAAAGGSSQAQVQATATPTGQPSVKPSP